ncbi:glucoamylase family protein [Williamwhitmania taraxaci]|uniref:Glycoamylase-like domain-containing protein n=1 Tax=Williamwhitmania taraxaci TaxID=1640674 RepID=A0A1G6MUE4_9BACT|nr:glucoamylase family protein [Williamwhitmania taraxaci]SDC58854.1 hypothetical protein SAMN05216323_103827 [Williamwhitmania taraxaci]
MLKKLPYYFLASLLILAACSKSEDDTSPVDIDTPDTCVKLENYVETITDDALLNKVQQQTLKYFWDFAEPNSGMSRERNTSGNLVTTGGTGFGIMAIIVGADRGFVTRDAATDRILKVFNFLSKADRFHGAWPHWMDGTTGKTIAFGTKDNGGDLIETAFLVQGIIAAKEYFSAATQKEDSLRRMADSLWYKVEWDWYTNGENVLLWHWSANYSFEINMHISGWNEGLITYVLAASSPTHPISKLVYDNGWAKNGGLRNGRIFYGTKLPLGQDFGGPLFFSHYSFLGLDPRGLSDQYANYWEQNVNHSKINHSYAVANPYSFCHYSDSCWGLTASDDPIRGYQAHAPYRNGGDDNGTITPTAALSSFPYTPVESMKALRFFYHRLNSKVWGTYGFTDAFNLSQKWYANSYLAIDQGPIVVMIENYRTGLLWNTFMKNQDIKNGLSKLEFTVINYQFY